jgi:hypothetical protein
MVKLKLMAQLKLGSVKAVVVKEIRVIKKKPSTLHWDNRKDSLRAS